MKSRPNHTVPTLGRQYMMDQGPCRELRSAGTISPELTLLIAVKARGRGQVVRFWQSGTGEARDVGLLDHYESVL